MSRTQFYQTVPFSPKPWPGKGERTAPSADVSCGTPGCSEDTGEPWEDMPCGVGADGARQEIRGLPGPALRLLRDPGPPRPGLSLAMRCTPPGQTRRSSQAGETWRFAGSWGDDLRRKMRGHLTPPLRLTRPGRTWRSCPAPLSAQGGAVAEEAAPPRFHRRRSGGRTCLLPLLGTGDGGPGDGAEPGPPAAGWRRPSRGTWSAAAVFPAGALSTPHRVPEAARWRAAARWGCARTAGSVRRVPASGLGGAERALPPSAGGTVAAGPSSAGRGRRCRLWHGRCLSFGSGGRLWRGCWRGPGLAVAVLAAPGARSDGAALGAERGRSGRAHLLEAAGLSRVQRAGLGVRSNRHNSRGCRTHPRNRVTLPVRPLSCGCYKTPGVPAASLGAAARLSEVQLPHLWLLLLLLI